jgi:hypothetical protein
MGHSATVELKCRATVSIFNIVSIPERASQPLQSGSIQCYYMYMGSVLAVRTDVL